MVARDPENFLCDRYDAAKTSVRGARDDKVGSVLGR
jgi:hypothetical protein